MSQCRSVNQLKLRVPFKDLAAAKKLIQQPNFGADNDDDDTVNWDGSSTKASTKVG